jgi:GntR family transcriptional regulator, transcriptional repressor for pyruvate dehydrogenase complex
MHSSRVGMVDAELTAIRKKKVYEQAAEQIKLFIVRRLNPGDKLPPERDLAEMLAMSRSSIRNAIRDLEIVGVIKAHQGAGTFVCEFSEDFLSKPLTTLLTQQGSHLGELMEFRRMLEPVLASRAATRASSEHIAKMEKVLRRHQHKMRAGDSGIEEDSEFHYILALATNNTVVLKVLDILKELLHETHEHPWQVDGRAQKSLAGHKRILLAIKRRDADAAEEAMLQHIEEIEAMVLNKP